mmetsp:Transcript_16696/g.50255  ORF Transcript_16696/g.50255 Transcript_16696/m.50255 type:complete len:131 (-) Transcript_16696:142-534(-)
MACAGTFERLGAQRQTEGRRQPEAHRPYMWPPGENDGAAGRDAHSAAHAQVVAAAAHPVLLARHETRRSMRRHRIRGSLVCARGADGAVEATVDVAYTCSLRETAHCARPPSAPSGIRRSRESPPTNSLL